MCFLFGFCFLALLACSLLVISITQKTERKKIKGRMVIYIINNKPQCHAHKHNKYTHVMYYIHRYLLGMYSRILTGRL